MGNTRKAAVLFLALIIAMSCLTLLTVKSASAWPISAPYFTVKVIDGTSTTPTTYSTDPYTGQTVTKPGTTYQTRNITVTIQNAPQVNYYRLEYRGHYATDPRWTPVYYAGLNVTARAAPGAQTVITISSSNPPQYSVADPLYLNDWAFTFTTGSKLDFRLEAVSGVETADPLYGWSANHPIVSGDASSWSTQTIQIGEPTNPPPTPASTIPESTAYLDTPRNAPHLDPIYYLMPISVITVVIAISALYIHRRRRKPVTVKGL